MRRTRSLGPVVSTVLMALCVAGMAAGGLLALNAPGDVSPRPSGRPSPQLFLAPPPGPAKWSPADSPPRLGSGPPPPGGAVAVPAGPGTPPPIGP